VGKRTWAKTMVLFTIVLNAVKHGVLDATSDLMAFVTTASLSGVDRSKKIEV
jgi:hypothetical protein